MLQWIMCRFPKGKVQKKKKKDTCYIWGGEVSSKEIMFSFFLHTHRRLLAKNKNVSSQVSSPLIKIFLSMKTNTLECTAVQL